MLYGLSKGLRPLQPRKVDTSKGYYGFRLRNTAAGGGQWWRVVEIEFCAAKGYVGKYNGTADVIASSTSGSESADKVFDGNLATTGGTYVSGWGSGQNYTVIGQYIGMAVAQKVPLKSARFLTWTNTQHAMDAVALDVLISAPGETETWLQIAALSGAAVGGQWFGWEDLG